MLKRIIATFISLIALGATVAVAEAPSAEGTPSSTTNIRNIREERQSIRLRFSDGERGAKAD